MFTHSNPYKHKKFMLMPETCPVCGQYFDIEVGFYYGSSYISYGISVAISIITFVLWLVLIGISASDNRIFYWLGVNAFILLILQPYLMRLARAIWLWTFIKYDPHWKSNPAPKPERLNESQRNNW
jgi:hypothetical protein